MLDNSNTHDIISSLNTKNLKMHGFLLITLSSSFCGGNFFVLIFTLLGIISSPLLYLFMYLSLIPFVIYVLFNSSDFFYILKSL